MAFTKKTSALVKDTFHILSNEKAPNQQFFKSLYAQQVKQGRVRKMPSEILEAMLKHLTWLYQYEAKTKALPLIVSHRLAADTWGLVFRAENDEGDTDTGVGPNPGAIDGGFSLNHCLDAVMDIAAKQAAVAQAAAALAECRERREGGGPDDDGGSIFGSDIDDFGQTLGADPGEDGWPLPQEISCVSFAGELEAAIEALQAAISQMEFACKIGDFTPIETKG